MFLKVAVTGFALLIGLPATATTTATPSAKAQRKLSRGPRVTAPASLSAIGRQIPARMPAAGKAAAVTGSSQDLQTASGLTWAEVVARRRQPTGWTVTWADDAGTPRTIDGDGRTGSARVAAGVAPHLQALSMVSDHAGFFRLQQPESELGHLQTLRDANGGRMSLFNVRSMASPCGGRISSFIWRPRANCSATMATTRPVT